MKGFLLSLGHLVGKGAAVAFLCLMVSETWALGLGKLVVRSDLGEPMRAELEVSSMTAEEESSLRVQIASPDSYRSAGVEYSPLLPGTQVDLQRSSDGKPYLRLTSDRAVQEAFVDMILEIAWNGGRLVREYTLVFSPPIAPEVANSDSSLVIAPSISSEPIGQFQSVPQPTDAIGLTEPGSLTEPPFPALDLTGEEPKAPGAADEELLAPVEVPGPRQTTKAPVPLVEEVEEAANYRVRKGDTLSKIAGRTLYSNVSLDQMLVSLYQSNPHAFVGNNMSRLKAGVVLSLPGAQATRRVAKAAARRMINAQSVDFAAYRQRLAAAVPQADVKASSREAKGKVQAAVEDRKQSAILPPDKLTLGKGTVSAGSATATVEDRISKEREKQDHAARMAELARNLDELSKLSGASGTAVSIKSAVVAAAQLPPGPMVATASAVGAPSVVLSVGSLPKGVPGADMSNENAGEEEEVFEPSFLDQNPWVPAGGGALIAVLLGLIVYLFSRRPAKRRTETSFFE